jgi:hypothetical protein
LLLLMPLAMRVVELQFNATLIGSFLFSPLRRRLQ